MSSSPDIMDGFSNYPSGCTSQTTTHNIVTFFSAAVHGIGSWVIHNHDGTFVTTYVHLCATYNPIRGNTFNPGGTKHTYVDFRSK